MGSDVPFDPSTPILILCEDLPSWLFLIDILLQFNTAYYKKGILITQRSKIIQHYLRGNFTWDLIIIIPFFISLYFKVQYLDITLILRSNKLLKITNKIFELLCLRDLQAAIFDFTKLVILILCIAHFLASGFIIFA